MAAYVPAAGMSSAWRSWMTSCWPDAAQSADETWLMPARTVERKRVTGSIVESVLVTMSSEAAGFIRDRGGRLWVWAARPRMCCSGAPAWMHAATELPDGLSGFSLVPMESGLPGQTEQGVQIWFRALGDRLPDVLEIGLHGTRRPRVEAYWDGCLMAMV
jgi:hypothetical protein